MSQHHEFDPATLHTATFWDDRYAGKDAVWSGQPNLRLVEQATHLPPGDALDLGCGEGGDAVWLANQGWQVTAVDVSPVAIARAAGLAAAAADAQVAGRITWRAEDALSWQPPAGAYDLVSMQFLHLPRAVLARAQARLATSVRAGGTLLIVNHDPLDLHTTMGRPNLPEMLLTAAELVATLDSAAWHVELAQAFPRPFTDPDGNPVTIHDTVVRAVRR